MKAIDIENLLKKEFIGKPYDPCHGNMGQTVLKCLSENGFDRSKLTYNRSKNYRNRLLIEVVAPYKAGDNVCFIAIDTKKKKTATHHSWYGSYCDWEYKDISVSTFDSETVEESCTNAVKVISARMDNTKAKETEAAEIFEFLKSKGYSQYDAVDLVKFASERRYALSDGAYNKKN